MCRLIKVGRKGIAMSAGWTNSGYQTPQQQHPVQYVPVKRGMGIRDAVELIAGAGIGAALMYLFDPDTGPDRREHLRESAADYVNDAGHALGSAWGTVRESAHHLGDRAHGIGGRFHMGRDRGRLASMRDSLVHSLSGTGKYVSDLKKRGSHLLERTRHRHEEPHEIPVGTIMITALGALALGAGLMYLMDPASGRRRRAVARDKALSTARHTTETVRRQGRYYAGKAKGLAAEARSHVMGNEPENDRQLEARVRTNLGRFNSPIRDYQISAVNGIVTLRATGSEADVKAMADYIRSINGVHDVVCTTPLTAASGGHAASSAPAGGPPLM
jgi:hypothetical protein